LDILFADRAERSADMYRAADLPQRAGLEDSDVGADDEALQHVEVLAIHFQVLPVGPDVMFGSVDGPERETSGLGYLGI
jgi:hypothetical protein